jgi:putative ABC transport system permease protein
MIRHYLVVALAKLRRAPFTTAANVLTLALGLACFIAAYGIATYWRSADGYHHDTDRIFLIGQINRFVSQGAGSGQPRQAAPLNAMSSWNLAPALRQDFPEIEHVARAYGELETPVAAAEKKAILNVATVDPEFLDIFDFRFVAGDRSALSRPNSVVLTEDAAERLFGREPAIGRPLLINGDQSVTVTGVIAPVRQPSFMGAGEEAVLRFDMLRDWGSSPVGKQLDAIPGWIGVYPMTFVRLSPAFSAAALDARLPAFLDRRTRAVDKAVALTVMHPIPLRRLTTYALDRALVVGGAPAVTAVGALFGLAALTLLVACINYANLATAQAAGRGKEIGIRKVLGAGRAQVMAQTWLEAGLLTLAALAVALAAVALAAPAVRASTGVDMGYFLSQGPAPWAGIAALVAGVALLAGGYPALVQSRLRPAEALESSRSRTGPRWAARLLVGVQFASASFLLILLTVTQLQRGHLEHDALAPHTDPVVVLNDLRPLAVDYDTLAARLSRNKDRIRSVSVVDHLPWGTSYNGAFFSRTPDPAGHSINAFVKSVGYDYFETLNLAVLAGRVFDRERETAPVSLFAFANDRTKTVSAVVDRRFARGLGFATPEAAVGQVIYIPPQSTGNSAAQPVEIIGVTETEWTRLGSDNGDGAVYTFGPRALWGQQLPVVRIAREDVKGAVAEITRAWEDLAPNIPLDLRFFDNLFEQNFRTYARVSQIFALLAGASFVIASIGQLGLAVHAASRRRHEIGVRKTLGSTTLGIIRLLLVDFSKPILAANLLAWPLGYWAAQVYLGSFADRVALTPAPFALSLAITLTIAWAAVIGEVWKVASVRPAEVLRRA